METKMRNLQKEDIPKLKKTFEEGAFDFDFGKAILSLNARFPDGQFYFGDQEDSNFGFVLSVPLHYCQLGEEHGIVDVFGELGLKNFSPVYGDTLYGFFSSVITDKNVLKDYCHLVSAEWQKICKDRNFRRVILCIQTPKSDLEGDALVLSAYLDKVLSGKQEQSVLDNWLKCGFHPVKLMPDYFSDGDSAGSTGILLCWDNFLFQPRHTPDRPGIVRLGLVQWKMEAFKGEDAFLKKMDFFLDTLKDYHSDFVLLPEFFNTPLLQNILEQKPFDAIRILAERTPIFRSFFQQRAISHKLNIVSGSLPLVESGNLYNVSYLCHRDGRIDEFRKIHITPYERNTYGMKGGNQIQTFDTDCGKVGILICYDVEFPEPVRILAEEGMKILFVPFNTDSPNAYMRVRGCARARAIENECYVAIAGSTGNLAGVSNYNIQYSQSGVFTPADFPFPVNGVKGEATANVEMPLVVDVDLKLLNQLHENGSVRNLDDRRNDLYEVRLNY